MSVQSFVRFLAVCAPTSKLKYVFFICPYTFHDETKIQWLDATPGLAWFMIDLCVPFVILLRQLLQDPVGFGINSDGATYLSMPPHVFQVNNHNRHMIVTNELFTVEHHSAGHCNCYRSSFQRWLLHSHTTKAIDEQGRSVRLRYHCSVI